MKKHISFLLSFCLILSACSFFGQDDSKNMGKYSYLTDNGTGSVDFSNDIEWDKSSLEGYLSQENAWERSYSGIFFSGNFDGVQNLSKEYSKIRKERVQEMAGIMKKAVKNIDSLGKIETKLLETKNWYFDQIVSKYADLESVLSNYRQDDSGDLLNMIKDLSLLSEKIDALKESPEKGFFLYVQYSEIFTFTEIITGQMSNITSQLAAISTVLEKQKSDEIASLNSDLTQKLSDLDEAMATDYNELLVHTAELRYGEMLLFTADYYFALDASNHAAQELAELKKTLASYKKSDKDLSEKIIDVLKNKITQLESNQESLKKYLEGISPDNLLPESEFVYLSSSDFIIPVAQAYQTSFFDKLSKGVEGVVKMGSDVKGFVKAGFSLAGEEARKVYDSSGAHEAIKDTGQMIGGALEATSSALGATIDTAQQIYYGEASFDKIRKNLDERQRDLYRKFTAGKLGKEQFDEMLTIVNKAEQNADRMIKQVSSATGVIAKETTSLVTGDRKLGKQAENFTSDVTRNVLTEAKELVDTSTALLKHGAIILHPETSKEETLTSMVELTAAISQSSEDVGPPDLEEGLIKELKARSGYDQVESYLDAESYLDGMKETIQGEAKDAFQEAFTKPEVKEKTNMVNEVMNNQEKIKATSDGLPSEQELLEEFFKLVDKELEEIEKSKPDTDKDGVIDENDNCLNVVNQDQVDTDSDEKGNECDDDDDDDGVVDKIDNCPFDQNPDQRDADGNGKGDVCDKIPVSGWSGWFSGGYSGNLNLKFSPTGSPLSGNLFMEFGSGSINGSVSPQGVISATVGGGMKYQDYDGNWVNCTLSGSFNGQVQGSSASGSYTSKCGEYSDSGSWSASR